MRVINPDIAFDNFFDKKKYIIARNFSAIICAVFFALFYFFLEESSKIFIYYILAALMMLFSLLFILFSSNYKVVYYILSIGGSVLIVGSSNFSANEMHYSTLTWSLLAVALAYFGANVKLGKILTLVHLVNTIVFVIFFLSENIQHLQNLSFKQEIGTAVELSSTVFLSAYIIYQFVLFNEYSSNILLESNRVLERKNHEIALKNKENVTLVKEVHHRVKNNLQIITSLLRLQKNELETEEAKVALSQSINRIMTMGLIHEKLYQQDELSNIKLKEYVESLTSEIKSFYEGSKVINVVIETDVEVVSLKMIIPLGLLMNELLTNSFKHAFKHTLNGNISMRIFSRENDFIEFHYNDSGTWKPSTGKEFGTELINSFVQQMDGKYERNGSQYSFNLLNLKRL